MSLASSPTKKPSYYWLANAVAHHVPSLHVYALILFLIVARLCTFCPHPVVNGVFGCGDANL